MSKKRFTIEDRQDDIGLAGEQEGITPQQAKDTTDDNVTDISAASTNISFPENPTSIRNFDFAPYYSKGFDAITTLCHSTIKKLLEESIATNQASLAVSTIINYCHSGLKIFFEFLMLWRAGAGCDLQSVNITDTLIGEYVAHLKSLNIGSTSQKGYYTQTKAPLVAAHKQGYLPHVDIKRLFPINPFPNSNRKAKGQRPLSQHEKKQLVGALKVEMTRILAGDDPLDSVDLTGCVLSIGLVTGMNPTPVLSLPIDCIQPHPLKKNLRLLVAFKRRGNATQVVSLRQSQDVELLRSVKLQVANTIDLIIERNAELRGEYKDPRQLLVFSSKGGGSSVKVAVTALSGQNVRDAIKTLIDKHQLVDDDDKPLKLNMMRLRKTFVNRMWELSDQDPLIAARQGKHMPETGNRHYWEAPPEAETNMRFIGEARVEELRVSYGPKENTALAGCKDTRNGHRAPKDGSVCTETLGCFRCKSFVVTEDDLYRLFSFYWAVVRERDSYGIKNWNKYLRHIIRIIDEDISSQFDNQLVESMREKAKNEPHPFWRDLTMVRMAR
ncbi:MAG: hypothetical protein GJ680_06205 [Alteromonadaceae bacterium]|nr:hypothetical protein [Alteromonadaceae bacterium]